MKCAGKNMNYDKLSNADGKRVSKCAFKVIDNIHDFEKHEQILGIACAFWEVSRQAGISHSRLMEVVNNIAFEADRKKRIEFKALEHYVKRHIIGED